MIYIIKEIWKDIEGYEGKYQASNTGKIKSLNYNNTNKEKVLIPKINKQGHLEITLSKNNKKYYRLVARLIIETFSNVKLNRNNIIMYKDRDETNCNINNLYIISREQRQVMAYDSDKRYRPKYEYYGEILSTKEVSKKCGMDAATIRNRMKRLDWNIYEAAEIPKAKYK